MSERAFFKEEHGAFRETVRRFIEREVTPHYRSWEDAGYFPREISRKAGAAGLLCPDVPEEYGGPGGDVLFTAIVHEELARAGATSLSANLVAHNDVVSPYIQALGTEQQKQRWLPSMVSGDVVASIGVGSRTPAAI